MAKFRVAEVLARMRDNSFHAVRVGLDISFSAADCVLLGKDDRRLV